MTNSSASFLARPIFPAGSGVTSKRRFRLYSASLPYLLRAGERDFFIMFSGGESHSRDHESASGRAKFRRCRFIAWIKNRNHRRMIAGSHLAIDRALRRCCRQRFTGHDVIETPADIALAHFSPWRPPREKILVVRIEGAPDINKTLRQDALEHFPFLRPLADERRVALLGMDVTLGARDVDVTAENHSRAAGVNFTDVTLHLAEKLHFAGEILAAVGNIDGDEDNIVHPSGYHTRFIVEGRMEKIRLLLKCIAPDMKPDTRVGFRAMPVAAIPL